jgi:hypothetical protein
VKNMSELSELIQRCFAERKAFIEKGEYHSPACVELFRRAFAGDEPAWEAIFTQVFSRDIRRFIQAAASVRKFSQEDIEEALQETQLAFWHYAPKAPTLSNSTDLAPIIAYLKKCAMSATATVARKLPPAFDSIADMAGEDADESASSDRPARRGSNLLNQRSFADERASLQELVEGLRKLLHNELERLVAQEVFINDTPPRELVEDYPDLFEGNTKEAKLKQVNQSLQTIRRRTKQSPFFQDLRNPRRKTGGDAFLHYSLQTDVEVDETIMPNDERCPFDEVTLLEYVRGLTPAEIRVAIERSPACVEAARALAEDSQQLTPLLRLALCPDVDTLIDYHEKRLPGAQQLVIHQHVQHCRQCQRESAMFAAIDQVNLQAQPSLIRQLFEALFLPPTLSAVPVRGALPGRHYRTQLRMPAIDILISTQKQTGKARTWTLRGELRTLEGLQFTEVEQIILRAVDPPDTTEITTTLEADGMFVFRGLATGLYSLHIVTPTEEILVRALDVGDKN